MHIATADVFGDELDFLEGEKFNARNYYIERILHRWISLSNREPDDKEFDKIVQQQVTVAKSTKVNSTVATCWYLCRWERITAGGSRRANTRFNKEAPRVGYCYARRNQQREFFVHLLVYSRGNQQREFLTHLLLRLLVVRLSSISRDNFFIPRRTVDTLYLLIEEAGFEAVGVYPISSISRDNFFIPRRTVDTLYLLIEEAGFEAVGVYPITIDKYSA
ncbi:hypothetical protein F511_33435 [Dorcoceras hygrometricum]|uniref:Uncharacterized protein n=1 Tax=Dorcoceras hygrometricum TaxID=472368 RepID=A0A2Z7BXV9_9LAMI|nr:hypothetical protein F511_33435 [Dorcoceras hygrometricum]